MIVWLTGTFGAGKTTTATELAALLHADDDTLRRRIDGDTADDGPRAVAERVAAAVSG